MIPNHSTNRFPPRSHFGQVLLAVPEITGSVTGDNMGPTCNTLSSCHNSATSQTIYLSSCTSLHYDEHATNLNLVTKNRLKPGEGDNPPNTTHNRKFGELQPDLQTVF